jgi:hypothetical protein
LSRPPSNPRKNTIHHPPYFYITGLAWRRGENVMKRRKTSYAIGKSNGNSVHSKIKFKSPKGSVRRDAEVAHGAGPHRERTFF